MDFFVVVFVYVWLWERKWEKLVRKQNQNEKNTRVIKRNMVTSYEKIKPYFVRTISKTPETFFFSPKMTTLGNFLVIYRLGKREKKKKGKWKGN